MILFVCACVHKEAEVNYFQVELRTVDAGNELSSSIKEPVTIKQVYVITIIIIIIKHQKRLKLFKICKNIQKYFNKITIIGKR